MNPNGNLSKIRQLAKQITACDGAINLWFLPYAPNIQAIIHRCVREAPEAAIWESNHTLFAIVDSCLVDVELLDDTNNEALALDAYFSCRNGSDPVGNLALFSQILSSQLIDELWGCWEDTRTKLPQAPAIIQEEAPPPDNPLGPSGSKAKKAKSTRKRTVKNT